MDRMGTALLWVSGILIAVGLAIVVVGNDGGSATEVGLLEGTPVVATATDSQCDALYEAIYRVKGEKNHYQLINLAYALDCPMEDK